MPTKRQQKLRASRITSESTLHEGEIAGYLRVSTDEQAESGLGLDAQRARVQEMARMKGWPAPLIYPDPGISGTIHPTKREQMALLIKDIKEHRIKVVIVPSLDRIGRTIKGILDFTDLVKDEGVGLVLCKEMIDTSNASGQLMLMLFAMLAQFERDTISERTENALQAKYKRDGDAGGRLPFGYRRRFAIVETVKGPEKKTAEIEIDPAEAIIVRLVFELRSTPQRANGRGATYRDICERVARIAPHGRYGGAWTPDRIYDIIAHEQEYRGGQLGDSPKHWPAILEQGEFAIARLTPEERAARELAQAITRVLDE